MDTPVDFSSASSSDDEHGFSDSGSDSSFDSDFDPETLKSHTRINTPRPSLNELQGILSNINDIDQEFMLDDIKMEMEIQQNNKTRNSFSYEDTDKETTDEHKTKSASPSPAPASPDNNNIFKHTETVSQTRIGKKWYINQYLCYKYLGKGSFGKVCLAKNILTNEKIAIKVLNKSILKRKRILRKNKPPSNMLENIFREIAIMKKLNHPNLIEIHEVIDDPNNDKLYMIIDYMNNGSVLGEQGAEAKCPPMTDHELIRKYIRDMILGLDYLHTNNIIHGDIKPENLLLSQTNVLKIADFGVSFMLNEETSPNNDGRISRSQGTPAFTAPETGSKSFAAYPIDVWAMGVTLYMMITGICPFAGNGIYDTYEKIQSYNPPIDELQIDTNMKDFLQKILQKDPTQRITLKEAMEHNWITKNGKEPLHHPQMYKQEKFEKRVSVTEKDVQYAVNLTDSTIQHLRKASDTIDKIKNKISNDDTNITEQPPKKISNKKPSKQTKKVASVNNNNNSKRKPSVKNKKKTKTNSKSKYNSSNNIVNMNQTGNASNKQINQLKLENTKSNPLSKNKNSKLNKKKAMRKKNLTPNPSKAKKSANSKIKSTKLARKPSRDAPIAPKSKRKLKSKSKSKTKLNANKTPKKPSKDAPINQNNNVTNIKNKNGSRKSTPNIAAKNTNVGAIKKKKKRKKGPLSPKNKALPPSIKKKEKKKKKKDRTDIESPSNISPSFVKRRTASEIKRNKMKSKSPHRKKNKNGNKKKLASQIPPKNKPLPKTNKKTKQTKNPTN